MEKQSPIEYVLESYMDSYGLTSTLNLISTICHAKAEHVRTNWQEQALAKAWERNAELIDSLTVTDL